MADNNPLAAEQKKDARISLIINNHITTLKRCWQHAQMQLLQGLNSVPIQYLALEIQRVLAKEGATQEDLMMAYHFIGSHSECPKVAVNEATAQTLASTLLGLADLPGTDTTKELAAKYPDFNVEVTCQFLYQALMHFIVFALSLPEQKTLTDYLDAPLDFAAAYDFIDQDEVFYLRKNTYEPRWFSAEDTLKNYDTLIEQYNAMRQTQGKVLDLVSKSMQVKIAIEQWLVHHTSTDKLYTPMQTLLTQFKTEIDHGHRFSVETIFHTDHQLQKIATECNGILLALSDTEQELEMLVEPWFKELQAEVLKTPAGARAEFAEVEGNRLTTPRMLTAKEMLERVAKRISEVKAAEKSQRQISNPSFSALSTVRTREKK
jgi:hypothetical protein